MPWIIETVEAIPYGGVAQLGEHLPCKQGVKGSIPFISTISSTKARRALAKKSWKGKDEETCARTKFLPPSIERCEEGF